jgi:hypothetical protein
MDSGSRITGGGSEYAALLAHAEGVLYGMELGSVTLKRIGFFCFPIKHSTHTRGLFSPQGSYSHSARSHMEAIKGLFFPRIIFPFFFMDCGF